MNSILKQPTKVRIAAAVLLVAGAAGAVALMRGSPAQSSESKPAPQAAAKPAAAAAPPPAPSRRPWPRWARCRWIGTSCSAGRRARIKDNRAGLDQWLRARLAEKALIEQARVQGWQDKPEVKRAFQAAQEQILMQSYLESVSRAPDDYPTEADLASAYERAKPQLAQPALYRVSQIFLPAPLGDAEAVAAARKQAQELVKRAQAPKADFAALARGSQDASSREQGGDIGFCRWPS